jgi:hypothetical protein
VQALHGRPLAGEDRYRENTKRDSGDIPVRAMPGSAHPRGSREVKPDFMDAPKQVKRNALKRGEN